MYFINFCTIKQKYKMTTKHVRTKKFTEKEKEMLISLINPYKNIIENIKVYILQILE